MLAGLRTRPVDEWVVPGRGLRDAGEEGRLAETELGRVSVVIALRRGLDAISVVPEEGGVEVQLEDLVLGEVLLDLDGQHGFLNLPVDGRLVPDQPQLDELLGDR